MPSSDLVKVLHVGLGATGAAVARQVSNRKGFRSVGAVDVDPSMAGRDLGEVAGLGAAQKLKVTADLRKAIKRGRPDVVVLCTGGPLKKVLLQIDEILKLKVPIVTTSKELVYPTKRNMRYARVIHLAAKKARVAVLATGVNPGFVMDALPIALTSLCESVGQVRVDRILDARTRRPSFLQKIGAGLTPAQFQKGVDEGSVRHVGLTESIAMIADALGWKLQRTTEEVKPRLATETVSGELLAVDAGLVSGIVQEAIGYRNGIAAVTLHLEAYLGAPESYDAIEISGSPGVKVRIAGGVPGDTAAAATVVNSIRRVLEASPGLHTMRDLPLPSFGGS